MLQVIGGLVNVVRPSPSLGEIVSSNQLGALLRHALTLDTTWGAPWALHALTCLLQDVLEGGSSKSREWWGSNIVGEGLHV